MNDEVGLLLAVLLSAIALLYLSKVNKSKKIIVNMAIVVPFLVLYFIAIRTLQHGIYIEQVMVYGNLNNFFGMDLILSGFFLLGAFSIIEGNSWKNTKE